MWKKCMRQWSLLLRRYDKLFSCRRHLTYLFDGILWLVLILHIFKSNSSCSFPFRSVIVRSLSIVLVYHSMLDRLWWWAYCVNVCVCIIHWMANFKFIIVNFVSFAEYFMSFCLFFWLCVASVVVIFMGGARLIHWLGSVCAGRLCATMPLWFYKFEMLIAKHLYFPSESRQKIEWKFKLN